MTNRLSGQIAKQIRNVYADSNWTAVNLKEQLADVTWEQANREVYGLNTILKLVFHIHYYVKGVTKVLEGGELTISDKFAFDHPVISHQEEWEAFLANIFQEVEVFASLIEQLSEERMWENMADPKYGDYFRNLIGIIEHTYYHLGQIAILKRIIQQQDAATHS